MDYPYILRNWAILHCQGTPNLMTIPIYPRARMVNLSSAVNKPTVVEIVEFSEVARYSSLFNDSSPIRSFFPIFQFLSVYNINHQMLVECAKFLCRSNYMYTYRHLVTTLIIVCCLTVIWNLHSLDSLFCARTLSWPPFPCRLINSTQRFPMLIEVKPAAVTVWVQSHQSNCLIWN